MMPKRQLRKCFYCGHEYFGYGQVCPRCHNPVGKKPKKHKGYKNE
jgi:uncharacterized OB-fold protein